MKLSYSRFGLYLFFTLILANFASLKAVAQCPVNIDFEKGDFTGWECWTGTVSVISGKNTVTWDAGQPGGPVAGRHTMLSSVAPGNGIDLFGLFPKNCPNGSKYSVMLGNSTGGHEAEGISYTFTIPVGQNKFSLIYHYAVVFQGPAHLEPEQPRLKISVENLSDGTQVGCSSFSFIPNDAALPGFFLSANNPTPAPVWCKDWSANTINLDGNAGKAIRIFFTTEDCTFIDHFGYAYIDLNPQCSSSFVGANFCPDDTLVKITAPFGYQKYEWYNKDFSTLLGGGQVLTLSPTPAPGDSVKVVLTPYSGYGCVDTLTAYFLNTLAITANAGPDVSTCNFTPAQIGDVPVPGLSYQWSPTTGLDDPLISNPQATPAVPTEYILTVTSAGGGCITTDTVQVTPKITNSNMTLTGNAVYCIGSGPFPVLNVNFADSIQWFRDSIAIAGATQTHYTVTQTGKYFAKLFSNTCPLPVSSKEMSMLIDTPLPGINYPVEDAVINFPQPLHARKFGNSIFWTPATSLDNRNSYSPVFKGANEQLYTIRIRTATGCLTVDTQLVKTHKKIEIYVPTVFTPGSSNGLNDYLRPLLMGISKVNYFRVYNRWGKLIFQMQSDRPGWDGKVDNTPQEMQTLVWMIEAVDVDGNILKRQGTTVLIR